MLVSDLCYKKLRSYLATILSKCLLKSKDNNATYKALLICRPVILDLYIRLVINIPATDLLGTISLLALYSADDMHMLTIPIDQAKLVRSVSSILNIKFKFGA